MNDTSRSGSAATACAADAFLAWLLVQPDGADLRAAARREIARLSATEPLSDQAAGFRRHLRDVAEGPRLSGVPRRRGRHRRTS